MRESYFRISRRISLKSDTGILRNKLPLLSIDTTCFLCHICSEIQDDTSGANFRQTSVDFSPLIRPKFCLIYSLIDGILSGRVILSEIVSIDLIRDRAQSRNSSRRVQKAMTCQLPM